MVASTEIHLPSHLAPVPTGRYAECTVCGAQWEIHDTLDADAGHCWCGAVGSAIKVHSENEAPQVITHPRPQL